jgi:hypothetical protein
MWHPSDSEVATARRLLVVVGLGYLVVQLLAFSLDRPPSWDEAIYLSQVAPGAEALPFVPSRARGITFLALPVLQLGGSLLQLRIFLAVASAVALTGAFRMWARVIGFGAVAAAVLFAGAWPALFYGSELMPNLWVAIIAVAATAVLGRRLARGEGRYDELVAGGLVAVAAMIRPLDAVVLTAALALLPFAVRRATVSWVAFLGLGLAAGWGPWLGEMTGRFGSPAEAFAAAARLGHTGRWSLFENVRQYLALSDGPSIGPVANPDVPASGVLWLLGLAILVTLGLRPATSRGLLASLVVPMAAGVALATEYVVFTDAQAPRFLLPALALLTIPAGFRLASMLVRARDPEGSPAARVAPIVAAALVVGWGISQFVVATRVEAGVTEQRASAQRVGVGIRELAARQPCLVYSEANFPIVGYAAGCRAAPLGKALGTWEDRARRLEAEGIRPFLVLLRARAAPPPEGATLLAEIPAREKLRWFIYGGTGDVATSPA